MKKKIESAEEYDLDQGNRIVNPLYITEKMAIRFFSMFWEEKMYMPDGERTGVIFHNAQIVGMTGFVLNNVKRRYFVMNVKIPNGLVWM